MVPKQANKRKTELKFYRFKVLFSMALLILSVILLIYALTNLFLNIDNETIILKQPIELDDITQDDSSSSSLPLKIDFQSVIDEWIGSYKGGNKSVIIYDLENEDVVGKYNAKKNYNTASLYKLFVVYEGYRRLQSGVWEADSRAGSTGRTIIECLDFAIRESNSTCAETLWAKIGYNELDDIIENEYKITNSSISNLVSNPVDIMKMMKIFYEHKDITDEKLLTIMRDSFLNQPKTTYDWRQGLPSGFKKSKVFNKVGWDYDADEKRWNIYHDAAIVETPDKKHHYIVVVMTNYVDYNAISQLGSMIEKHF